MIAVELSGEDLEELKQDIIYAIQNGHKLYLAQDSLSDNQIKWKVGGYSWTEGVGTPQL